MGELVTPSQGKQIIREYEGIISRAVNQIKNKSDEFAQLVKENWADANEVKFLNDFTSAMDGFISELNSNNTTFSTTVQDLVDAYRKTGNLGSVSVGTVSTLKPSFAYSPKETFEDGETTGFKTETSADTIKKSFNSLISELEGILDETNTSLASLNAFGNSDVKNNIAKSGGTIVSILRDHIQETDTNLGDSIESARDAYLKTGNSAASAAILTAGK